MDIHLPNIIFIHFFIFQFILSIEYLKKYDSVKVDCDHNNLIILNSFQFTIPSSIYFKFSTNAKMIKEISYEFYDKIDINEIEIYNDSRFSIFPSGEAYEIIYNINNSNIIME